MLGMRASCMPPFLAAKITPVRSSQSWTTDLEHISAIMHRVFICSTVDDKKNTWEHEEGF
jgi:hypothetical protein